MGRHWISDCPFMESEGSPCIIYQCPRGLVVSRKYFGPAVTIPGLFSLETSNSTRFVPVITHGLPAFNFSGYDLSNPLDRDDAWQDTMDYARRTLYFLASILGSTTTLGVRDGTLYDVPERNAGTGNVTVNATGFNITCRYVTDMSFILIPAEGRWEMKSGDGRTLGWIERTQLGIISTLNIVSNYTFLYSIIPILDSGEMLHPGPLLVRL
ncbi:hypothetical protein B0H13DRAFT_335327 [Mycena leptocephala]|nr:hypothetical protein B0H13DRAFT_335327 [Mycena leptocephala]